MLTPGPAAILYDNIEHLIPLFGRGDDEYSEISTKVLDWVLELSGQDRIIHFKAQLLLVLSLAYILL